jgi:glycosyltransferase involved in cell wall biosynthesis
MTHIGTTSTAKRLKILTWHVHGNYLYYLTQVPHDFYLVTDAGRTTHHTGRSGTLPWGDNVHEVRAEEVATQPFDVILYQSREAYEVERHQLLSAAQQNLPRIYLEHDPPQESPTNTRHWVDDPNALLVHCTHFNALMWDNGRTPSRVIEHGIRLLSPADYTGERKQGVVVVNNLDLRGRRLGVDVYLEAARQVPLVLVGMGAERIQGGAGEVTNHLLPQFMAQHRFFFNPIRYTSLGLSILEAMMVGVPIVGLATTELVTVIRDGENGYVDTRLDKLVEAMQHLLKDPGHAREIGQAGRRLAMERFSIERFVDDWLRVLREVTT